MKRLISSLAALTLVTMLNTVSAKEYMDADELFFDWNELVGTTVKFQSQVGIIDLRERIISIGDDFMTEVDVSAVDRDTLLWVSRNCDFADFESYNCWMLVEGTIKKRGEFDFVDKIDAQNIEFVLPYAIAVSAEGWYSLSYIDVNDASSSLEDYMFVENARHNCCAKDSDWVNVRDINMDGLYLSAVLLGGWDSYELFTAAGPTQAASALLETALAECEGKRAEGTRVQRAVSQCYEVFSDVVYE